MLVIAAVIVLHSNIIAQGHNIAVTAAAIVLHRDMLAPGGHRMMTSFLFSRSTKYVAAAAEIQWTVYVYMLLEPE